MRSVLPFRLPLVSDATAKVVGSIASPRRSAPARGSSRTDPSVTDAPSTATRRSGPPPVLPGEHFAAGLAFLLLAALVAVWYAPLVALGAFSALPVLAVVHLLTLGWLTTSIMGALYQFLPVVLGVPIASERAAHASFALYAPGVLAFTAGLGTNRSTLLLAGVSALAVGAAIFVANLSVTLRRAAVRDVLWWSLAWALGFLTVTLVLGAALSANLRLAFLGPARPIALGAHLHIALVGWVMLSMLGVSQRLYPMFLLSHGTSDRYARWALRLMASGAAVLAVLHHVPVAGRWLPALLIAAGVAAFLLQSREFFRHRHRRRLDRAMQLSAFALGGVACALPLAALAVAGLAVPRLQVAYVALVLLSLCTFVAAHYYRIIPFLVWNHRFGALAGTRPLPRVAELYSANALTVAAGSFVAAAVVLVPSAALGLVIGVRAGAALFLTAALVSAAQMVAVARRRP